MNNSIKRASTFLSPTGTYRSNEASWHLGVRDMMHVHYSQHRESVFVDRSNDALY